jgi:hypothetical protein
MIKNPLITIERSQIDEINFLMEFTELVSWVREHIIKKVCINELLNLLKLEMNESKKILSRVYGRVIED